MVIIQKPNGQLCNQLFTMAHFAAPAIEYDFRVFFPGFEYPLEFFPNINSEPRFKVMNWGRRRSRAVHLGLKLLRLVARSSPWHEGMLMEGSPYIHVGEEAFVAKARRKLVTCEGFGFRDIPNVKKHHQRLKELFRPSQEIENNVEAYMKKHGLEPDALIVGFHIRRGDYRRYRNGEYCFKDESWIAWINEARSLLNANGKCFAGLIFSNEKVEAVINSGADVIPGPGNMYEDLHMLSKCDYIVGPPSTYSGWASYIGRVPVQYMTEANAHLEFDAFKIVEW